MSCKGTCKRLRQETGAQCIPKTGRLWRSPIKLCWHKIQGMETAQLLAAKGIGSLSKRPQTLSSEGLYGSAVNNRCNPVCVDSSRLATLDAQLRKGWVRGQNRSGPAGEVRSLCENGQLDKALDVLLQTYEEGTVPPVNMYSSLLKACTRNKTLTHARRVHAHLAQHGLDTTSRFLGEYMVSTLVKCGGLEDALHLFCRLPDRTVFSWTALIAGYARAGQGEEALRTYHSMLEEGVEPDEYTFASLLQACGIISNLEQGKRIHAEAVRCNCDTDSFVGTCLLDMYAKCGSGLDAQIVFDSLSRPNVVSWNAMLAAYAQQGQAEKAVQLYRVMREEGVSPDDRTFVSALQACGMLAEEEEAGAVDGGGLRRANFLGMGKAVHADARLKGYESDVFVGSTLVSMYGRCGSTVDAQSVFDFLLERNVVSWNAMLAAYAQQGQAGNALQLYEQMQEQGVSPDDWTFVSVLQACCILAEKEKDVVIAGQQTRVESLGRGRAIHAHTRQKDCDSEVFVGSILISMYGKSGSIVDAEIVFARLSKQTVVSWTAMISAYAQQDQEQKALHLYKRMVEEGVTPGVRTFVSVLCACCTLAEKEHLTMDGHGDTGKLLAMGRAIHADICSRGYSSDVFVGNTLVSMYGKCGSIADAQNVFDGLVQRDVVSWNALLGAYVDQGQAGEALQLYNQMQEEGMSPNDRTFVCAFQACGMLAEKEEGNVVDGQSTKVMSLQKGREIHVDARSKGYDSDVFIANTLVSMYGKCGSIVDAEDVFDRLSQRNVVSWNVMLRAYVEQSQGDKALQLYRQMQGDGMHPDEITLVCILQACGNTGNLEFCRQIHHSLVSTKDRLSRFVANTLIHVYGRCASMVDAQTVFDALCRPDVVSWTTLIAGYAREGNCAASLQCYEQMLQAGVRADGVTFLSLLYACSHAGLVDKGVEYFESMSRDFGIAPAAEHYASMVDLLGRSGYFQEVEHLLSTMPTEPNVDIWLCVLGACRYHGKVVLGKKAFDSVVRVQPKHAAAYVLMSNIYAQAGMWECANEVHALEQKAGSWKKPTGQSWIQHEQESHTFLVGDLNHSQQGQVYSLLGSFRLEIKEKGHVADSK